MAFDDPQIVNVGNDEGTVTPSPLGGSVTLTFEVPNSAMPNGNWASGVVYAAIGINQYGLESGSPSYAINAPFVLDNPQDAAKLTDIVGGSKVSLLGHFAPVGSGNGTQFGGGVIFRSYASIQMVLTGYLPAEAQADPRIVHTQASSSGTAYSPPIGNYITQPGGQPWTNPSYTEISWRVYGTAVSVTGGNGSVPFTQSPLNNSDNYASVQAQAPVTGHDATYTLTVAGPGGDSTTSTWSLTAVFLSVQASLQGNAIQWSSAGGPGTVNITAQKTKSGVLQGTPLTLWVDPRVAALTLFTPFTSYQSEFIGILPPASGQADISSLLQNDPSFADYVLTVTVGEKSYPPPSFSSGGNPFYPFPVGGSSALLTQSQAATLSVPYPEDSGTATAIISTKSTDSAKGPTGGGGGTTTPAIPRRSCLSAPGSRYCRAEDSQGGGISFHRANGPVPMLRGGTLWEATSSVTVNPKDSGPALFLDQRGILYCCFARVTPPTTPPAAPADTSHDGVYLRRSDDYGKSWGAHLDSNGTVELMAIPGGMLPAAASGNGSTLVGAITGNDKDGYKLQTCYKSAGQLTFSVPVVAVDSTGKPLAVQNSGIALCLAAEGPGRWILSALIKGDTSTSEWWSSDSGSSFTRVATS